MPPTDVVISGPSVQAGRENNKVRFEDGRVHEWYRFILSFPPHLVRDYLDRFAIGPCNVVLDPFCGAGTTLVECTSPVLHTAARLVDPKIPCAPLPPQCVDSPQL